MICAERYLTNIIDDANNKIEFAYNDLGQMVAMADPDLGVWKYERDFAGRLREQTDAKNQRIIFNYNDPLGRLKSKEVYWSSGVMAYGVTNFYDSSDDGNFTVYPGQLFKVVDEEWFEKNRYDGRAVENGALSEQELTDLHDAIGLRRREPSADHDLPEQRPDDSLVLVECNKLRGMLHDFHRHLPNAKQVG